MSQRSVLFAVFVRLLYPLMLLASIGFLLRGHNAPGGGFIGGMVAVAATSMRAVADGADVALRSFPLGPAHFAAASGLLSLLSGIPALFVGLPYMTHLWVDIPLGFTELMVSTVHLFDIGVYGVVWSALGGIAARAIGIDEAEA